MGVVTSERHSQAMLPLEAGHRVDAEEDMGQSSPLDSLLIAAKRQHAVRRRQAALQADSTIQGFEEHDDVDPGRLLRAGSVFLRLRRLRENGDVGKAGALAAQLGNQLRAAAGLGAAWCSEPSPAS
mmetsp:Transcript_11481/g.26140  ORF Transcript_11481/g.26140 Transcript_11481/m.26140 type:complete len:126 (-) Transcript_11481:295-672(-)